MKKVLLLALAVSLVVAGMAVASVVSSKHDMRLVITNNTGDQVCIYCHHPHRGYQAGMTETLLWNFQDTSAADTFDTYGSSSMQGTVSGDWLGTSGNAVYSAYCLVCHDGDFGADALVKGGGSQTGSLSYITSYITDDGNADNIGGDTGTLTNDHPVDFDYTSSVALDVTQGIKAPAAADYVQGSNQGATTNYPLYSNYMQCATCHDVHNGDTQTVQFMRGTNALSNSNICRDCHTNK